MRPWVALVVSGGIGFLVGWLTRPLVEGRGFALTSSEVLHHALAYEDHLLRVTAHQTISHVAMFGISCALLGFVVARLSQRM